MRTYVDFRDIRETLEIEEKIAVNDIVYEVDRITTAPFANIQFTYVKDSDGLEVMLTQDKTTKKVYGFDKVHEK